MYNCCCMDELRRYSSELMQMLTVAGERDGNGLPGALDSGGELPQGIRDTGHASHPHPH